MVYAMIPARGGSRGIPRKNLVNVNGAPLIEWTINAALLCEAVDFVVVNTDDDEIDRFSEIKGAHIYRRPERLGRDDARTSDVVCDFILHLGEVDDDDIIITLQPTSPIRSTEHIRQAAGTVSAWPKESVISGCAAEHPAEWQAAVSGGVNTPVMWARDGAPTHQRRQVCPQRFRLNGSIYAATAEYIMKHHGYYGPHQHILEMDREHSIEIDEPIDLTIAEAVMRSMRWDGRVMTLGEDVATPAGPHQVYPAETDLGSVQISSIGKLR